MKVLFSDFDGTLFEDNKPRSLEDIHWIEEMHKDGHMMIICTGRSLKELEIAMKDYPIPFDYAVLNNGGHIINERYETLYEKTIDRQAGIDILNLTTSQQGIWSFFCEDERTYGYKDGITIDHATDDKAIDDNFFELYQNAKHFQIISFHQEDLGLDKILYCLDEIKKNYGHQVEAYLNTKFVDVVPKGCSKGGGVQKMISLLNDDIEAIYAIGDSFNDISMIEIADYGYTFVHADEKVKEKTHLHVNYVYEVIQDMLGRKEYELEE